MERFRKLPLIYAILAASSWSHASDCIFRDEISGRLYDLSPLIGSSEYTVDTDGVTFYLQLCVPVSPKFCGDSGATNSSAACAVPRNGDEAFSIGDLGYPAAYALGKSGGVIALDFERGAYDRHHQVNRSMTITFACDPAVVGYNSSAIYFIGKDTNTQHWYFHWATNIVCERSALASSSSEQEEVVDPFLLSLVIVVPVLAGVLLIVAVVFCAYCCRRNRSRHDRSRSEYYSSAACLTENGGLLEWSGDVLSPLMPSIPMSPRPPSPNKPPPPNAGSHAESYYTSVQADPRVYAPFPQPPGPPR